MQVDPEYLRRHYATLSDEEFAQIDRKDLVEVAQKCYDEEVARRGPMERAENDEGEIDFEESDAEEPEWMEGAASAYVVVARPGTAEAPKAAQAARILRNAGLPVFLSVRPAEAEAGDTQPQFEYHVLVPGELSLHAASVLDKEVFNEGIEQTYREYFRGLSDDELQNADTEMLFAGIRDRLKRITKSYKKEMGRRGFEVEGKKPAEAE